MKNLFLIFLLLAGFNVYSQDSLKTAPKDLVFDKTEGLNKISFDKNSIEEYRTQKDFEYLQADTTESWWSQFKKWLYARYQQFLNWLFGDYSPGTFLAWFIKILPFILLLFLLGVTAWLFSRLTPAGPIFENPAKPEVLLNDEELLLRKEDLPSLIRQAVMNRQYRFAVRYFYLKQLKNLEAQHHIRYEFQKTNRDYQEEIVDNEIRGLFAEITKLYEFIWYGGFDVSEADYKLAEKGFLKMERSLKLGNDE